MGQLFFKKPLQEAIREGRKRTTIRRWARPLVHAGRQAYAPGVGWLAIESVEPVELEHLSDADAVADGFETRSGLVATLHALYPDRAGDGKRWFKVRFTLARGVQRKRGTAAAASKAPTRSAGRRGGSARRGAPLPPWDPKRIPQDLDAG